MFDGRPSLERLSFFVLAVACVQAQAPATTTVSEGLFVGHSGNDKKMRPCLLIGTFDGRCVTSKQILDPSKFQ